MATFRNTAVAQQAQGLAKQIRLAMAHDQSSREGIAARADADLKRAAILDEACSMDADGVVGLRDRFLRWSKEAWLDMRVSST